MHMRLTIESCAAQPLQVNRGFRVQYSSAIGPYKGGLRFHPSGECPLRASWGRRVVARSVVACTSS